MGNLGGPGIDPRVTIPAGLAQQQAAKRRPGIPLITDEEAERRQREADARRRRSVIWRRILVVLAALAIGACVLIWLGPPGVAGQDEEADPLAPTAFTARNVQGLSHRTDETGAVWHEYRIEATDERASGVVTRGWNEGMVGDGWHRELGLYRGIVRLVNDDGAWTGTSSGVSAFEDQDLSSHEDPLLVASTTMWELVGEGAYEGLNLYLVSSTLIRSEEDKFRHPWGIIVPTDIVPTAPEPPAE